ncbi:lipopolysaccharide assembly protein LapA domain-containing protein [Gilvimarinus sp. DA14]|uniref:lipopolysaccharide assembly protein LapA domain-containing protein n=1 Tax=Gilvimarinus sp. DA14 TaxID=2956798 RepID=UPI0020B7C132|nr:lipopolysaccharide assembly protein LapA domain-containing protein [Gilvimarinus sp. DA14]UTF60751.1 lipopolysaccharide assembly protein LapA domain-containing protein [Gilvimarinus sp. DA14]
MKKVAGWIYLALALVAVFFGYLFSLENSSPVAVTLFGFTFPALGLGLWLLGFALIGLLLGMLVTSLPVFVQARKLKSLIKRQQQLEQELRQIRSQSLRD